MFDFDVRRLRGTATTLAFIVLALMACRLCQAAFVSQWPAQIPKSDWTFSRNYSYDLVGKRLAGALGEAQVPGTRYAASLGSSSHQASVDPGIWDPTLPSHKWLHLYGNAIYADGFPGMGEILFASSLKPEVIVIGFSLGFLSQADDYVDPIMKDSDRFDLTTLKRHFETREFRSLKQDVEDLAVVPLNRLFPGRIRANTAARYVSLEGRLALFRALGIPSELLFPPDPTPWKLSAEVFHTNRLDDAEQKLQIEGMRNRGWFNPANYDTSRPGFASFVRLIELARSAGTRPFIVLLPERAELRGMVPPVAEQAFRKVLQDHFAQETPPVIDLRDSVPETGFCDMVHLNAEGCRIYSERFAKEFEARK